MINLAFFFLFFQM